MHGEVDAARLAQLLEDEEGAASPLPFSAPAAAAVELVRRTDPTVEAALHHDIDALITGVRAWQDQHEKELAALLQKNEEALRLLSFAPTGCEDSPAAGSPGFERQGQSSVAALEERLQRLKATAAPVSAAAPLLLGGRLLSDREVEQIRAAARAPEAGPHAAGSSAKAAAGAAAANGAAAASVPVGRGQQLLDELEAELKALDEGNDVEAAASWYQEVDTLLMRMDALQTGYQAAAAGRLPPLLPDRNSVGQEAAPGVVSEGKAP